MKTVGHDRARFLGLESVASNTADVLLIPVPYEGTVSYGKGTAAAPAAVLGASGELEVWDEELDFELDSLTYHVDQPVFPA
ncbi:MAG: arginase family protein, partial [Planctomycetaceae bacterium]